MTAQLIDGNALAARVRAEVAARTATLRERGVTPGLAVILVGDDPASAVYVRHKVKDCEGVGMRSVLERYPATMGQADLLARVRALNDARASTASWCRCRCRATSTRCR
jgi:methylenetetrahydrofolate dehydrogenase (NADP+)/methenyltetrahydrofolate cyclohydrolase